MKNFLWVVILFLAVACNTPCSAPGSAASLVAGVVVNKWQCKAPEQVLTDVSKVCAKLGLCRVPVAQGKTGPIAMVVCPLIVGELERVVGGVVPASWECDASQVGQNFGVGLTMLCEALPL